MSGKPQVVMDLTYGEIARRLLLHQTPEQIAQAMRLELGTVKATLSRLDFKDKVRELEAKAYTKLDQQLQDDTKNIRTQIAESAQASLDRLTHLLQEASSEGVQMRVAQDLLDRGGFGAPRDERPQNIFLINPIDAEVIATALQKEELGKRRLEGIHEVLLDTVGTIKHPLVKHDKDGSGDSPESVSEES